MAIANDDRKPLQQIPADVVSLHDYEQLAWQFLPHAIYESIAGGNADEITVQANRQAFDDILIYNRVLNDCSRGNTRIKLLGETFAWPVLLAPVALQQLVHEQGELATAQAATVMETGMISSSYSSYTLEDIAAELPGQKWFQLYFQEDREFTLALVQRAEAAAYTALVVTVDVPLSGLRNRAQRAGFVMPAFADMANLRDMPRPEQVMLNENDSIIFQGMMAAAPTWQDIAWLAENTTLPIIIKGISHPDDARRIVDMGLAGIVVSNHGGRALDGVPAAIELLPAVRAAVGNDFTVLMDGGIRRGSDVLKARALGADAVLLGRPQVYALSVAGALGVAHMLRLLRQELEMTMALAGCPDIASITPQAIYHSR